MLGLHGYQARRLGFALGIDPKMVNGFARITQQLYQAFIQSDASLAEINPLIITTDNTWQAIDSKMVIDNNALYRHKDFEAMRDLQEEVATEVEARAAGISFVKLDGNIGCVVNGAGLSMATMDAIKLYGGEPANFLDVGGGASAEQVAKALELVLTDPSVQRHPDQHLRRHHPRRRGRARAPRGAQPDRADGPAGRATGRHEPERGPRDPGRGRHHHGRHDERGSRARGRGGARRGVTRRLGDNSVSILVNSETRLIVQGITGREGSFHTGQMVEYGTNVVGGRDARAAAAKRCTASRSSTRCKDAVAATRRQRVDHLRAGPVRAGRHLRGGRRRHPARRSASPS